MNFALAQSMVHRPRVLRGGQAPRVLKRELSCLTEGVGTMPRRCNWVREIVETHPQLLSEPLLGECLVAVTATRVVRSESNDEAVDNRLTSPRIGSNRGKEIAAEPTAFSKREQLRSPAVTSRRAGETRQIETVSQLPRRAHDSLLRRAGPENSGEHRISATLSLPHAQTRSPSINSTPQITRSEWLNVVADRAAKKWTADWVFPPTCKYSSPVIESNRGERARAPEAGTNPQDTPLTTSSQTVETVSLPSLNDNWLLAIGGQQASPQLLTSLVNHARSDRGKPEQSRRSHETPNRVDSELGGVSSVPDPRTTRQQSFNDGPDVSRRLSTGRQSPSPPANQNFSSTLSPVINSEEFAPTVLTPDLSPLLPPASVASPPISAAANTTRQIAWRDEVEANGTDLSVLAAQMKRILDEEARRHGIDV